MCIILHKPKGVKLDPIIYQNCFNRNDDGTGFAFVEDDKLVIKKGITKLKTFLETVESLEHKELIIHCRLMSKGEVSHANCHPFRADSKEFPEMSFAVMHNGTLSWRSTDTKSDTAHFVEDVIQPIIDRDAYFFDFGINRAMIGSFVSSSNKLVIMRYNKETKEQDVYFVNKGEGIEYNGCWFSNLSFTEETSRFVSDSDRKRIKDWKPELFVEKVVTTYNYQSPGYGGHHGGSEDFFRKDAIDRAKDGWGYAQGYGWYSRDKDYKGARTQQDFEKWVMAKTPKQESKTEAGKQSAMDTMDYLDTDELKKVRKLCVAIVKDGFPNFDLKCSTIELATFARGELRELIPALRELSNEQLMNHILYGEEIPAVEKE